MLPRQSNSTFLTQHLDTGVHLDTRKFFRLLHLILFENFPFSRPRFAQLVHAQTWADIENEALSKFRIRVVA